VVVRRKAQKSKGFAAKRDCVQKEKICDDPAPPGSLLVQGPPSQRGSDRRVEATIAEIEVLTILLFSLCM